MECQPSVDEIFEMYAKITLNDFRPVYVQVSLGSLRSAKVELMDHIKEFLEKVQEIPDSVVVTFSPDKVALLVDENRNLLEFA